MAVAGRKPKPTTLRIIEGNREHRPLNEKEPKPRPVAPECPEWLKGEGRKVWENLAPKLEKLGILTEIDGPAFAALCQCYGRFVEAEKKVDDEGTVQSIGENGYRQQIPEISISQKYLAQARALLAEFGGTPSSRSRLSIETSKGDEFDEFLN